ncbi:MAG: ribose-5-phosphate isomerase RpiA [Melioribacteraceae bacterium]|nr:ribose-5-phosphate isomerase RpiA [Melioribacteraceae bacterium]
MTINELKRIAAQKSVEDIKSGMVIGLGSGSTFQYALELIGEKFRSGELKDIKGVASSSKTEAAAKQLGIPLITLNQVSSTQHPASRIIDLTIDGADEVTVGHPERSEGSNVEGSKGSSVINLIKGGGGALLHEKVIAQNSKKLSIIIDENKLSETLGSKFAVPVEVIPFAVEVEKKFLESIGAKVTMRVDDDGNEFITDEGNLILDAEFGKIKNVDELNKILNSRAGIVEHGMFLNLASVIYCATKEGIKVFNRS